MAKKPNESSENLFNSGFEIEENDNDNKSKSNIDNHNEVNNNINDKFTSSLPPTEEVELIDDVIDVSNSNIIINPISDSGDEKNDDLIKNEVNDISLNEKDVKPIANISEINPIHASKFDEFNKLYNEAIALSKNIVIINGDIENASARDYGKTLSDISRDADKARKEYNNPYQKIIDDNNDSFNTNIIIPVKKEVERLKQAISFYENEKEKKRLAEVKRLEDEKKAKEEKERLERERIAKIRESISKIQTEGVLNLEKCNTLSELNTYEAKITGWKLKPEYYSEFIEEAQKQKDILVDLILQRKPLLEEIERKQKEADELQGEQREAAQREADLKSKELESKKLADEESRKNQILELENKELESKQELTILVASFGLKNVGEYIKGVIEKYGSATNAIVDRDKLVNDYRESLIHKDKVDTIISEKVKNVKLTFEHTIIDENLIPREFLSVDESKIKKHILANRENLEKDINSLKISGLIIYPKKSTILNKK